MATIQRAGLQRGDMALWDGVTKTTSRVDATGGTVTGLTVGDFVDVLQVYGSGTSRSAATISTAVSRIASNNATLLFATGTWTIDSSLTIPSNLTCFFPAGCVLSISSGVTLTFSGLAIAEQPSTLVTGDGSAVFSQEGGHGATYHITAAEIAAEVTPTNYQYPELNLRRYGGAPGTSDNTTAMDAAESVIAQKGAGEIILDSPGVWKMNWVCTTRGVTVRGAGGQGEFDAYVIRPFALTSAPITWGDGTADVYYGRLINVHVSGSDGSASGDTNSANNAPQALILKSVVNFRAQNCVFYNGLKTVSLIPSATNPVTGAHFIGCAIRNDITDDTDSRCVYGERLADPGYYTDNAFIGTKMNKSGNGYAIELYNNGGPGIVGDFMHVYCDHKSDYGLLLKGTAASVRCHELQLDPGTTGVVVISTDQAQDSPTRFISGTLRHGGQKMEFDVDGTPVEIDLPAEAERFGYRDLLQLPKIIGPINFGTTTDPYDASTALPALDSDSDNGPMTILRSDWSVKTVGKGFRVAEGSNAKMGISGAMTSGVVTVSTTAVTANSRIFLTRQQGGTNPGVPYVSGRTSGTSFEITSTNASDTGQVAWILFEPA